VDVEEDFIDMKIDEIYIPSALSIKMTASEVSVAFSICLCVIYVIYNMAFSSGNSDSIFTSLITTFLLREQLYKVL
jgi:hypothetical protein